MWISDYDNRMRLTKFNLNPLFSFKPLLQRDAMQSFILYDGLFLSFKFLEFSLLEILTMETKRLCDFHMAETEI